MIHPTAVIDRKAQIDKNVEIGPYCTIDGPVKISKGTKLISHVVVQGRTTIGENCTISPFASLGGAPQDITYKGEDTQVIIGVTIPDHGVRHDKPGYGTWRGHNKSWGSGFHYGIRSCSPRLCPGKQCHYDKRRNPGRSRGGGRLRYHRRFMRNTPVLQNRTVRLCERHDRCSERCAAFCNGCREDPASAPNSSDSMLSVLNAMVLRKKKSQN